MPDRRIENVIEQTIDFAVGENVDTIDDVVGVPIVPWLARGHAAVPPWWSFARDGYLREFWKRSSHMGLMMYTAQTLLANTPMRVEPKDPTITSHVEQAEMYTELLWKASEFGETLFAAKARFAEDYLAADNGGFFEVLGDGPPDGPIIGPPLAVRHLDSQYCWRTRNPEFPVVYHDPLDGGRAYKLHTTRVIAMAQMSSTEALMNGVGFSAVSRSLQFGQHLYDIYVYKQEKLGSRPISKLIVGSGFRGSHIMQAVKAANEAMSNQNLSRYSKIIGIGSDDPAATLAALDLNDFDPFDEDVSVNFAMFGLAAAFGIPIQEVWAVSGGRSGRSGDMQESRQRGKLPAEFNAQLSLQLSRKYLPPYLRVVADWRDDYQDERRAVVQDIRARNRERDIGDGAITIRGAREQMVEVADLTRDQFVNQELGSGRMEDGTPVAKLFYSDEKPYKALLKIDGVDNPTAIRANEKDEMQEKIDEQKAKVHEAMAEATSPRETKKLQKAIAALDWLWNEYEEKGFNPLPMELAIAAGQPERGDPNLKPINAGVGRPAAGEPKPSELADQPASKPDKPQTRTPDESREGSVEGKERIVLRTPHLAPRLDSDYFDEIIFQELWRKQVNDSNFLEFLLTMEAEILSEFDEDQPSKSKLRDIVTGWLLFAYLEGIGKSEDDLTAAEMAEIKESQDAFVNQVDKMLDRKANGNDMRATTHRLTNQAAALFWLGFVKGEDTGEKYTWILGTTKEHCSDCLSSAGQTKTRAEWGKGPLPQSGALECTGRYCLCYLSDA
jgi:hypothetical protein